MSHGTREKPVRVVPPDLESWPTIGQGHFANLKVDTGEVRIWHSRMTLADGETEPIQIEELQDGSWVSVCPHDYIIELGDTWYRFQGPPRSLVGGVVGECYDHHGPAHAHRRGWFCA
jgi:hypothetical protein